MKIYKVTDLYYNVTRFYRYYKESYLTDWGHDPNQENHKLEIVEMGATDYLRAVYSDIPEEFLNWICYKAYEDGHAWGDQNIIDCGESLADGLELVIQKYTNRIKSQYENSNR